MEVTNEGWLQALRRAVDDGLDATELVGGGDAFAWSVESASRPGTAYVLSARGERCSCPSGAKTQPCKHAALVRYLAGALELPREACRACCGTGAVGVGVGWSLSPDATECDRCRGEGSVEMPLSAMLDALPRPLRRREANPAAVVAEVA